MARLSKEERALLAKLVAEDDDDDAGEEETEEEEHDEFTYRGARYRRVADDDAGEGETPKPKKTGKTKEEDPPADPAPAKRKRFVT